MGCIAQKTSIVSIKSEEYGPSGDGMVIALYSLEVPRGFKFRKYGSDCNGFILTYSDSSQVYLVDDQTTDATPNYLNWRTKPRRTAFDTLENMGILPNKRHWHERIVGEVIVGYVGIPESKRLQFDSVLMSLRRKQLRTKSR